jgi:hypothetical protein
VAIVNLPPCHIPLIPNGEDRQPLEKHFFGTLSHVVVQHLGVSDIYAEVAPWVDLRLSELDEPPLLRAAADDVRVRVVGSSNR